MVLIYSSSTHNYIDIDVIKKLNLFVCPTKALIVTIANVKKLKGLDKCHKVSVQIQVETTNKILHSTTRWDGYGARCGMADAVIGHLYH